MSFSSKKAASFFALAASALLACDTTPTATIQLDEGGETDTFTRAPVPTTIVVNVVDDTGASTNLYNGPVSATMTLQDEDQDNTGYVDIIAYDSTSSAQNPTIHGRSLPVAFDALDSDTPLDIFVQRTGEFARMPSTFDARTAPLVDVVTGRYLLVAGGTPVSGDVPESIGFYDQLAWQAIDSPPNFPIAPVSLAMNGTIALLLGYDTNGNVTAETYDFSDTSESTLTAPSGFTFDEVFYGSTVYADDGTAYIVGATRTSTSPINTPTSSVLKIGTDGTLTPLQLNSPRLGAAAVWVEGIGVVVVGGTTTASAVEIIDTNDDATDEGYAPIDAPMLSAAAINIGNGGATIIAGATPLAYAIPCLTNCTTSSLAVPSVALVHADYFPQPGKPSDVLAIGWGSDGNTHAFDINATSATEIPLKVAHQMARGLALPNGAIAVIGGATQAESYFAN